MEPITETIKTVAYFTSMGMLGYFMWMLRELNKDVKEIKTSLTALFTEHNLYKELNKCPLVRASHIEVEG